MQDATLLTKRRGPVPITGIAPYCWSLVEAAAPVDITKSFGMHQRRDDHWSWLARNEVRAKLACVFLLLLGVVIMFASVALGERFWFLGWAGAGVLSFSGAAAVIAFLGSDARVLLDEIDRNRRG
ncbi:MAG: hypothetical protein J0L61_12420 [Planctomycetes bacterium]|nr:hypothetical protein [Planctomycetota bacterium]